MLIAVSVVSGFRSEIRSKIIGFDAHISLYPSIHNEQDPQLITYTPELKKFINSRPYIKKAGLLATAPVLLKTPDAFKGLYMRGVTPDYDISFITSTLCDGKVPAYSDREAGKEDIIISRATAEKLNINPGDSVNMYLVADNIRARRVKVSGLFDTHFNAYDQYFAYASAAIIQELTSIDDNQGSAIDIVTTDFDKLPEHTDRLIEDLNREISNDNIHQNFQLTTTLEKGNHYFAWLDLLDTNVWVILTLMTVVAAFTLISGMLIIILEKVRLIGILKSLGASKRKIRQIFIFLAIRISIIGLLIGNAIALAVMFLQKQTHAIPLDADAYYMDFVPVNINPIHILIINAAFIVVIYLALILPSRFAARITPAETMRFE